MRRDSQKLDARGSFGGEGCKRDSPEEEVKRSSISWWGRLQKGFANRGCRGILLVTGDTSQAAHQHSQLPSHQSQVTNRKLQVTSHKSPGRPHLLMRSRLQLRTPHLYTVSTAVYTSSIPWARPQALSRWSWNDCTPSDTLFTPALRNPFNLTSSNVPGSISIETSALGSTPKFVRSEHMILVNR